MEAVLFTFLKSFWAFQFANSHFSKEKDQFWQNRMTKIKKKKKKKKKNYIFFLFLFNI